MKKAETSQMFQMLMTLIVVGMILLLGTQLIGGIFERSSQIDYIKFRRALTNSIDAVASDYNAEQRIELSVPRGIESLCFVDMAHTGSTGIPIIDSYWSDTEYRTQDDKSLVRNAFLIGRETFVSFRVDNLGFDTQERFVCIDTRRSNIEFWAIGRERTVSIEPIDV